MAIHMELSKIYLNHISDIKILSDGEYFFKTPKGFSIKLLNFDQIDVSKSILVCFNAAISNRSDKTGPFYSGAGLSKELNLPTILIADHLVTENNNLSLGWYLGDGEKGVFQKIIASFLNELSNNLNRKLILLGGSGGGICNTCGSLTN